jgi:hypothetical protein
MDRRLSLSSALSSALAQRERPMVACPEQICSNCNRPCLLPNQPVRFLSVGPLPSLDSSPPTPFHPLWPPSTATHNTDNQPRRHIVATSPSTSRHLLSLSTHQNPTATSSLPLGQASIKTRSDPPTWHGVVPTFFNDRRQARNVPKHGSKAIMELGATDDV